jgi:DNA mismatch repair protein MutS
VAVSFETDKQTLSDLNIFGGRGDGGIYDIFNRCHTRGGGAILEDMFRRPLCDEAAINRRVNTLQGFAERAVQFPFESADLDAAEIYLAATDERTRLSAQVTSVVRKLGNMIAMDAQTKQIHAGIEALAVLFTRMRTFLAGLDLPAGQPYADTHAAIVGLMEQPPFETDGKTVEQLDGLLRFRHRDEVLKFLSYIYELDALTAVGRVARERKFAFPHALPRGELGVEVEDLVHPQVENAVANSLIITADGNVLLLTGANMAGKSTFMRSLGLALYLAHMGFPVPARAMRFSVLDGIYTTINLPDDLGTGASHFYAEVLRVKKIATELSRDRQLAVICDELFRGTNVKDAGDATVAIASGFARKHRSLFVISTHSVEAAERLNALCSNVRYVCQPTRMDGDQPLYTYKLESGVSADRHGMTIVRNAGILDILERGQRRALA